MFLNVMLHIELSEDFHHAASAVHNKCEPLLRDGVSYRVNSVAPEVKAHVDGSPHVAPMTPSIRTRADVVS